MARAYADALPAFPRAPVFRAPRQLCYSTAFSCLNSLTERCVDEEDI